MPSWFFYGEKLVNQGIDSAVDLEEIYFVEFLTTNQGPEVIFHLKEDLRGMGAA